jgi:hypothetical protein
MLYYNTADKYLGHFQFFYWFNPLEPSGNYMSQVS